MILTGDYNIKGRTSPINDSNSNNQEWDDTCHVNAGNLGLSDGSVQQTSSAALRKQCQAALSSGTTGLVLTVHYP
jgi:hypothetical protein